MSTPDFRSRYGPWAIVAGASVGIGAALADQLAAKGLALVLIARTRDRLEATCEALHRKHGVEVRPLPLDLSAAGAATTILDATADLDVGLLVYNAALGYSGAFWACDLASYHTILGTNILTPLDLVYGFGPRLMRKRRGGIVMISSAAGQIPQPYLATYAGTKAWNTSFSLSLWGELRPYNVTMLNAIVGATDTPGLHDLMPDQFFATTKLMTAEQVAREVLANIDRGPCITTGRMNRLALRGFAVLGLSRMTRTMTSMALKRTYGGVAPKQPIDS